MNTNDPGKAIAAAFFKTQDEKADRLKTAIATIKRLIQQDKEFGAAVVAIMHTHEITETEAQREAWSLGPITGQQIISDFIEANGITIEAGEDIAPWIE